MRTAAKSSAVALLLCVSLSVLWCPRPLAAAVEDDIVRVWRERQQQWTTVRFRISGSQFKPAGYLMLGEGINVKPGDPLFPVPAEDRVEPSNAEILLDLENQRLWRRHIKEIQTIRPTAAEGDYVPLPSDEVCVYNGELFKSYQPDDLNLPKNPTKQSALRTELVIGERPRTLVFYLEHNPVLYACGIIRTQLAFDPLDLRPEINPAHFKSEGEVDLDGNACVVLRTVPDPQKRFFEFWVDAADPRKIRQVSGYGLEGEGKLWFTTKIKYQATEEGPIPKSWTIDRYSGRPGKVARFTMELAEFEANPEVTDADFDIDPPPGTKVLDFTRPEDAREYVVAEPGKPELPLGEHLLQEEQSRSRRWLFAGIVGVMILLLGVGFFVYRRRRA